MALRAAMIPQAPQQQIHITGIAIHTTAAMTIIAITKVDKAAIIDAAFGWKKKAAY